MDTIVAMEIIAGICIVILVILLLKKKAQLFLNFLVRIVLGAIGMIMLNDYLAARGIAIAVGMNPVSLLTVGCLGFPGFLLLYGIVGTKFL